MKKPEPPPNGIFNPSDARILAKILQDRDKMDRIFEIEKDYPYWDVFKQKVKRMDSNPEAIWRYLKTQRNQRAAKIKFSKIPGFDFKYNIPAESLKRLHEFDLNLGGILEESPRIPEKQKEQFLISSIMEEAIASSQLEGAVTTRVVAKAMLREKRKPRNHSERMILNNYLTIQEIVALKEKPLSIETIKQIHAIISKNTLDKSAYEGDFRRTNEIKVVDDITGEVFYDPPSFDKLEELMQAFCDFANAGQDEEFIHPIVRGIMLHFLIGYIHPFVDGNGRTARALFYWYLLSRGYWLIEFLSISRIIIKSPGQYAKAYLYTEYDENDLTYFIDYNLKAMKQALIGLNEYINRKLANKRNVYELIVSEEMNERQASIIADLINDSDVVISISEIQSKFNTAYQTARTDLMKLEQLGYLKSKQTGKKFVYFKSNKFEKKLSRKKLH